MSVPRVPIKRDVLLDMVDTAALQAELTIDQIERLLAAAETTTAVGVGNFTPSEDNGPSCPWSQAFGIPKSQDGEPSVFADAFDKAADRYVLAQVGGRKRPFYTLVVEDA